MEGAHLTSLEKGMSGSSRIVEVDPGVGRATLVPLALEDERDVPSPRRGRFGWKIQDEPCSSPVHRLLQTVHHLRKEETQELKSLEEESLPGRKKINKRRVYRGGRKRTMIRVKRIYNF